MEDGRRWDDELLGAEAVARRLGVGLVTVYRWCRQGRLTCFKLGKAWRIRRSALEVFLRRAERSPLAGEGASDRRATGGSAPSPAAAPGRGPRHRAMGGD